MGQSEQDIAEAGKSKSSKNKTTREFWHEGKKLQNYSIFDFIHGYIYARWPYQYIGVALGGRYRFLVRMITPFIVLFQKIFENNHNKREQIEFADTYHGKAIPLETATRLVSVKESIALGDLEQVIPYKLARDLILKNPDHIVVLDCPCRVARKNPCLPLDVCLVVGEPFASLVVEHHPQRSRWITSQEAVGILEAEDDRGHVHHAFFKDAMLGRFYAICNCCDCCCGAMQAHRNGIPMLASSGYVAKVNREMCIACGTCEQHCQFNAITMDQGGAVIDFNRCMGCGVCVNNCPEEALELLPDASKGLPLDLKKLSV